MRVLRGPLLHFILIGAALFAAYAVINPATKVVGENTRESKTPIFSESE